MEMSDIPDTFGVKESIQKYLRLVSMFPSSRGPEYHDRRSSRHAILVLKRQNFDDPSCWLDHRMNHRESA